MGVVLRWRSLVVVLVGVVSVVGVEEQLVEDRVDQVQGVGLQVGQEVLGIGDRSWPRGLRSAT